MRGQVVAREPGVDCISIKHLMVQLVLHCRLQSMPKHITDSPLRVREFQAASDVEYFLHTSTEATLKADTNHRKHRYQCCC